MDEDALKQKRYLQIIRVEMKHQNIHITVQVVFGFVFHYGKLGNQ